MKFEYHSEQFQNQYSKEENRKFTEQFSEITEEMHKLMIEGVKPDEEAVQISVKKHYEFIAKFWKPNKQAYKSLAMMYILPSDYKTFYDNYAEGLGQYTYEAITIWADRNLE